MKYNKRKSTIEAALAAYEAGNDKATKELIEGGIGKLPEEEAVPLRLLRARVYEFGGYPEGIDLGKAYNEYRYLQQWTNVLGSEAIVGAARVLFDLSAERHREEINNLCHKAIDMDGHVHAKMLLGLLSEKVLNDRSAAKRWYLSAYFGGLPWGLRYLARLHAEEGSFVRASLLHMLTSITSPFLVLRYGVRGPFSEHVPTT